MSDNPCIYEFSLTSNQATSFGTVVFDFEYLFAGYGIISYGLTMESASEQTIINNRTSYYFKTKDEKNRKNTFWFVFVPD